MSTAFKQVKNNAKGKASSGSLNNITSTLTFSLSSGASTFPDTADGSFYITVWRKINYPDAGDDPNMRIGLCTSRAGNNFTVTWGQLGTSINAIEGSPTVALLVIDQHLIDIYTAINDVEDELASSAVPDATALVKGLLKLTGDLGGTADSPEVKRTARFIVAPYGDIRPADYVCAGATNNQIEINQAIDAANALPGGARVELLDGNFVTSSRILRKPNVHIRGQGMLNTKVTTVASANFNIFDMDKVVYDHTNPLINSSVEEMEIDGSNFDPSSAVKAINGGNFKYCKIYRIYAHDTTATGIGDDDFYGTTIDQCIVINCGYTNKRVITAVAYSSNTFTFTTSTAHGYIAWTTATGTLTASGTISDGDTVTIGDMVYTFKTTLTGAAYEVLINGSVANALINLKSAVNLTGTIGTDYGLGTIENPEAIAGTITSTTLAFTAPNIGDSYNTVVTTETSTNLSWGSTTLIGGIDGNRMTITGMIPTMYNGQFLVSSIIDATHFTVSITINSTNLNLGTDPGSATTLGFSSDTLIGHNGIGVASGALTSEACIVTNCICVDNQNNNFLIEADANFSGAEVSYIYSNCISFRAGSIGYRNTGSLNAQFNNCFDYGSPIGGRMESVSSFRPLDGATWSAGVITFTTSTDYLFAIGQKVQVSGMVPSAYNGFYTIKSTPTSTTFTVNLVSDPGLAVAYGTTSFEVHPVDGSSFNSPVFESNINYGIDIPNNGVQVKNVVIKNCLNYGVRVLNASYVQIEGRIYGCGRDGILIQTSNAAAGPMTRVSISGHIYNNSWRIASNDGIDVNPSSATPIQNLDINVHSFDDQDVKTQRYGIILRNSGTLTNINVRGNLTSNATAPLLLQNTSSSISIDNIIGVNPECRSALGNITGSVTFDISIANFFTGTLIGNITPVMPNAVVSGSKMTWVLTQDATGSRTTSIPANAATGTLLTLSTVPSAIDILTWIYDGTSSKWRLLSKTLGNPSVGTLNNLTITTPDTNNTISLNVTQNDVTNNPDGTDITNAGTSHALKILQNGVLGSSKYGLFVDSAAVQVNSALARLRMSSASATQPTLQLDNAGSGSALLLNTGNLSITAGKLIKTTSSPPASAGATGVVGQIEWDTGFIYVCTATNTWKRVAIATW